MAKDVNLIIGGDSRGAETALQNVMRRLNDLNQAQDRADRSVNSLSMSYGKLTGIFAAIGAGNLAGDIYRVTGEFDKLQASLETITGSLPQANAEFGRLQEFAKNTPYKLTEVVTAFNKLSALDLDASTEAMTSYGNTAGAMGKSMIDMIEAVADASTGEFERLKEFGIKARTEGDKVVFNFRGVSTEVANNSAAIVEYLQKIGNTEFAGGMKKQMDTIDGAASNLADTYESLLAKLGKELPIKEGIETSTKALELLGENLDVVGVGMAALTAGSVVANLGTISTLMRSMAASSTMIAAGQAGLVGLVGGGAYFAAREGLEWMDDTFFESKLGYSEKPKQEAEARAKQQAAAKLAADDKIKNAERAQRQLDEAKKKAEADTKKNREKELAEIQKHNDRILDIEKKRIDRSLKQEEDRLQALTDKFKAAVDRHNSIVDASLEVKSRLGAMNTADQFVDDDQANKYWNTQDELQRKEEEIRSSFAMTAEQKAKAYVDLIELGEKEANGVTINGAEIISQQQAQYDKLERKKRLTQEVNQLLDQEEKKRFDAAVKDAEAMDRAKAKTEELKLQIEDLETALDRINNKEINIIFKATGIEQLLAATGAGHAPGDGVGPMPKSAAQVASEENHTPGDGVGPMPRPLSGLTKFGDDIKIPDINFAVGTAYVPRTGYYQLHRGEEVRPRGEVANGGSGPAPIIFSPNITMQGGGTRQEGEQNMRELARLLSPELRRLAGERYRH